MLRFRRLSAFLGGFPLGGGDVGRSKAVGGVADLALGLGKLCVFMID